MTVETSMYNIEIIFLPNWGEAPKTDTHSAVYLALFAIIKYCF